MAKITILPSQNEAWGYSGTIECHASPTESWALAMTAITAATGCANYEVRAFLDSRHGRHFADEVANGLHRGLALVPAIDAAVARWMSWTISRRIAREEGIPHGLPYLTGYVMAEAIAAEDLEAA